MLRSSLSFAAIALVAFVSVAVAQPKVALQAPGSDSDLRDDIRAASLIFANESSDSQEILAAAQADYIRLLALLYDNARYGGVISILIDGREASAIPPLSPPSRIERVLVRVTPGPVYRFGEATVAPVARGTELPEEFRRGAPAQTGTIQDTAAVVVDGWRNIGHAKARVSDQRITANHASDTIRANLRVAPGPKLRFGTVSVRGNQDVRTRRVLKIAGLEEGRTYDPAEVQRAVRRLRRTGAFSSVTAEESERIGPNNTLPMEIAVVEATPRRFGFGAEIATIEGVGLSAFWLHRNFLGGAERVRVDGEISGLGGETGGVDYNIGVRYERPATPKADTDLFTELSFEHLDEPDFRSDTTEFILGFTRYATEELTVEFGLGYLYSDVEDDLGQETFSLITLPLSAQYERRDNPQNARDGYYIDLEATPFYGLSGTDNGAQIKLDARGYETFGERLTFAARLQLGSLFGPDLVDSPPFYRFYSGGGGTVRGQDYQSLGIDLGGGDSVGGRSFLGLSGEVRAGVTEAIDVVGFVDWGYIGTEAFPDFSGDSHAGAGLGLRYNTGIGPIRLDLAAPVSGDTGSSGIYIYVGIGQAF